MPTDHTLPLAERVQSIATEHGLGLVDSAAVIAKVSDLTPFPRHASDDYLVARLKDIMRDHSHLFTEPTAKPAPQGTSPGLDPGFKTFLGGLGEPEAWSKLSPENRLLMRTRYDAEQAAKSGMSDLQRFEREMVAKYGSSFRTTMTPTERATYGTLTDSRHDSVKLSQGERLQAELDGLRASTSNASNLNITMARAARIAQIEKLLGIEA